MMKTQTPPRRRLSAAERRDQILDATGGLVGADGFSGLSIEAIARAAGITRPIVYGHFGDLEGVVEALLDRELERATEQLATFVVTDLSDDPNEQLLAGLRGYLEAVRAHPFTWRLMLMPPDGAPPSLRARIEQSRREVTAVIAGAFATDLGPDRRPPDPELAAVAASSVSDGWARLVLMDPDTYTSERILRQARWFTDLADPGR